MAELADARVSKTLAERRTGSTPVIDINYKGKIMASLNGLKYSIELVKKGWEYFKEKELRFGDPKMIDPVTKKVYHVYEAKEIQDLRDKK